MINLNTYILEKLTINKDTKVSSLEYPVYIEVWVPYETIYKFRDTLETFSSVTKFGIQDLLKKNSNNDDKLYRVELEDRENLLAFLVYCHAEISIEPKFEGIESFKKIIENYDKVIDYLKDFSDDEYQKEITKFYDKK